METSINELFAQGEHKIQKALYEKGKKCILRELIR